MADKNKMRLLAWILSAGLAVGGVPANVPALAASAQGSTEEAAAQAHSSGTEAAGEGGEKEAAAKEEEDAGKASSASAQEKAGKAEEKQEAQNPKEKEAAAGAKAAGSGEAEKPEAESDDGSREKEEEEGKGADAADAADAGSGEEGGQKEEEKEAAPGGVRFLVKGTDEELGKGDVSFDRDSTGYKDGQFLFDGASIGDKVRYTAKKDGYKEAKGEFTLKDSGQSVEVALEKERKDASVTVTAAYGDGPIDLAKELEDAGYGSASGYSVESGKDVVSVTDKGVAEIKKAGSAAVAADMEDGAATFKITVKKHALGELSADDIDWAGTEREEDGTEKFALTGAVKGSAGLIGSDSITVTADAQAESEKPGTWGTSLSNIKLQGADNYDASLAAEGPKVTIIKKKEEIAITAAYGGSARNGKYFSEERPLSVTVTGDDFEEGGLAFRLTVDGEEEEYTAEGLQSGAAQGVSLKKEGDMAYALTFGKEGEEHEYALSITYGDKTAKMTGAAKDGFVVDMAAPELAVAFADKDGKAFAPAEGTVVSSYEKGKVTATLSVKDGNFDKKGVEVTVGASDADGKALSVYGGASGPSTGDWQSSEKSHSFTMEDFTEDANYAFSVSVKDLAGNEAKYPVHAFGIDKDAPKAELAVAAGETKTYADLSGAAAAGIAAKGAVRVTASASDTASGVDRIQYYIDRPEVSDDGKAKALGEEALSSLAWKDMPEKGVEIGPDSMSVVYLMVTDRAGNASYVNTKDVIIADGTKPEIEIKEEKEGRTYSGDIALEVNARDVVSGEAYSGIAEVLIEVVSGGEATDAYKYFPGSLPERALEFSAPVTVDAQKNNSNSVIVRVKAKDAAGNEAEEEREYAIDTAAPEVTAEVTNKKIRNGHYLNETAELEVSFRERNFIPGDALFSFTADGREYAFTMEELSEGKGRAVQVIVKGKKDSQEGAPYRERTDERLVSYVLQLGTDAGADTAYGAMRFSCTDPAGNAGRGRPQLSAVTVDKIAPVITATYSAEGADITGRVGSSEEAPFYTQKDVTARFTVKDTNFAPKTARASVAAKDHSGESTGSYSAGNMAEGWTETGAGSVKELPVFTQDANYSVAMEAEDLAGNRAAAYPAHYFTIDKTAPKGRVYVRSADGEKSYAGFSGNASFESVSGAAITVAHSESDETSGIASVSYYRYTPPVDASGRFRALSLSALRSASWEGWDGELKVSPDSQAVVYARIADRAGNILYISTDGAMLADRTDPWNPEIGFSGARAENGIYAGNVPVTVSVSDREAGGTYAGLKDVVVEVLNGRDATQRYEYHPGSKADRVKAFGTSITIDAAKNNANNITVRVTARDHAGNVASSEKQVSIDITSPVIEVTYDNNSPSNGKYYNKPRTATIVVRERNFDPSRANLVLQDGAKASGWSAGSGAGSSDDARNTCTVTFGTDGDYAFTLNVRDKAGNSASYGKTDVFTIDMTAPVIRVVYNVDRESGFYNAARTATIHVTERNFRAQEFEASVRAALEGRGIAAPSISGWGGTGDDHAATLTFAKDGVYSFSLAYTDLASNKAQGYSQGAFTIDMTAPVVEITGVEDGSANRGKAMPVIRYTDLNYTDDLTVKLTGTRHDEADVAGEFARLANGGQVSISDFAHAAAEDDVYTLTARSADKAGNVTEKSIRFSINRFGSNFYLDDATKEAIRPYYIRHAADVIMYEVNVDKVTDRTFTIYRDGSVLDIPENAARIEEQDDGNGWNKYRYVIDGSLLDGEGQYEVVASTTDAAGNRQENRTKGVPVAFVVDRTPPSAVITGAEDGKAYYSAERGVEVHASDDRALAKVEVMVDGELQGSYEGEELEGLNGTIPLKITESDDWRTISATAYDAAGNASAEAPVRILVTTNRMNRLKNSFLPAILCAALAAFASAAAFLAKRLKDGEEEDEDDGY